MNASESEVRQGKGKERERESDETTGSKTSNRPSPKADREAERVISKRTAVISADSSSSSWRHDQLLAEQPRQGAHFRDRTVTTARPVSPCRHTGHLPASLILIVFISFLQRQSTLTEPH